MLNNKVLIDNKVSQKKNMSSIQVLKTLQVLMQGDYSMNELIEILNKNEQEPIFNNSVISKYINTCRYCGFDIQKINNIYYVAKIPFGIDLSMTDIELLSTIQLYVKNEMSTQSARLVNSFMGKISRLSDKCISRVQKDELVISTEIFERAIAKQRKVKLMFKNRAKLECIPLGVHKEGEKVFFNVYCKNVRNIDVARLSGIELTDQAYKEPFGGDQVVVFKLKGSLAKRYEARDNEVVEHNLDGTVTVTNKNENKEALFSRLLRYDDKCEILQPKGYRADMKDLIDNMLSNYGVN